MSVTYYNTFKNIILVLQLQYVWKPFCLKKSTKSTNLKTFMQLFIGNSQMYLHSCMMYVIALPIYNDLFFSYTLFSNRFFFF